MKKALIFGVTGQGGSYLAEELLQLGYSVDGIYRRASTNNFGRIAHLSVNENFNLFEGDITDANSFKKLLALNQYDHIYNLAAQSHVHTSFTHPKVTFEINALGCLNILEAIRDTSPNTRLLHTATSEMFGLVQETPQTEKTPFYPRSPYGVSKVAAFWLLKNYRESYNIFASNVICFNYESSRRGSEFVTKKIIRELVKYKKTGDNILQLGNLESKRDWGYAKDYVKAMIKILEHDTSDDFVIATNETHTVREFVEEVCNLLQIKLAWVNSAEGTPLQETGWDVTNNKKIIEINEKFFRPAEVDLLIGDYSKAEKVLNWKPETKFKELVKIMVDAELKENIC